MAYILLYVDDIILTTSSDSLRENIMSKLSSEFAMKDLGPLGYFLGISVTRHSGGIFLSQKKLLNVQECPHVSHPQHRWIPNPN